MNIDYVNHFSVLFVCTANICRSPMAAGLLKLHLQKHFLDGQNWKVDSAGTWARNGEKVSEGSRQVMLRRGLDLSEHRSKMVSKRLLREFNLILTMEAGHKEALQIEFPEVGNRIFMLSEMNGTLVPVRDPYGGPLEGYEAAAERLDYMISRGLRRIMTMAEPNKWIGIVKPNEIGLSS